MFGQDCSRTVTRNGINITKYQGFLGGKEGAIVIGG